MTGSQKLATSDWKTVDGMVMRMEIQMVTRMGIQMVMRMMGRRSEYLMVVVSACYSDGPTEQQRWSARGTVMAMRMA